MLLQHGLLQSSAVWVDNGPDEAMAFILADAGFDVWLVSLYRLPGVHLPFNQCAASVHSPFLSITRHDNRSSNGLQRLGLHFTAVTAHQCVPSDVTVRFLPSLIE